MREYKYYKFNNMNDELMFNKVYRKCNAGYGEIEDGHEFGDNVIAKGMEVI